MRHCFLLSACAVFSMMAGGIQDTTVRRVKMLRWKRQINRRPSRGLCFGRHCQQTTASLPGFLLFLYGAGAPGVPGKCERIHGLVEAGRQPRSFLQWPRSTSASLSNGKRDSNEWVPCSRLLHRELLSC